MMKNSHLRLALIAAAVVFTPAFLIAATDTPSDGAQFSSDGKLTKPVNYREWPLVGTGIGMAYGPLRETPSGRAPFTNVFVNPSAYQAFLKAGAWPDKTIFILEIRDSVALQNSTTGNNGYFQGEVTGIEAHVKDEQRFTGKWAFFGLNAKQPTGTMIPTTASCYSCHEANGAVDTTFTQFYPVLRDVAKEKGTFKKVPESF